MLVLHILPHHPPMPYVARMTADLPEGNSATWTVLSAGYADERVAGTVVLIVDGDTVAVVDPGMVADRAKILDPLAAAGVRPIDVTDVVFSHHHPDHTLNAALFPAARVHDFQAIYHNDTWIDRDADGTLLSPSVRFLHVPGHTPQDMATVIGSPEGIAVCTHAWWTAEGPAEDPFAPDAVVLGHRGRTKHSVRSRRVLAGLLRRPARHQIHRNAVRHEPESYDLALIKHTVNCRRAPSTYRVSAVPSSDRSSG